MTTYKCVNYSEHSEGIIFRFSALVCFVTVETYFVFVLPITRNMP